MGRPPRVKKTPEEVKRNFKDALDDLSLSMKEYDRGSKGVAGRLAATIYNFAHDYGKSSVSLLTQINRKNILFHNTAVPLNPKNLLTEMPLVIIHASQSGHKYIPIGKAPPPGAQPDQSFSKWWETKVLRDKQRREFTRKNLVFNFRNGEGGGHVSPDLDEAFADLARNNSMGFVSIIGNKEFIPEHDPKYATIRQIAYELHVTLTKNCSDYLT